jgi:ribonucleoside-diphosphate reductase beta chain
MKGMGQIVTWSVRDETLHCNSMIRLFKDFIKEEPQIWNDKLKTEIYDACKTIVKHEDAFIDLAFQMGPLEGLTANEIKQYIRFIGNRRLEQLGLNPIYDVKKNPLTWLDNMLNGVEHMNFFEGRATEYSKASTKGTWGEVFA